MEEPQDQNGRRARYSASPMRRLVKVNQREITSNFEEAQKRTIKKWIKQNDVSQLMGANQQYIDPRKDDSSFAVDEKKEVSTNMTILRKKFDEVREICNRKEQEIANMRLDIEKLKADEEIISGDTSNVTKRYEQLQNNYNIQQLKFDEALLSKSTYEHVLERMKRDQISFKMKQSAVERALNERSLELTNATEEARKAKQLQAQSKYFLDELMRNVGAEKKKREESLMIFKHTIKQRQEIERSREERIKKTQDITENAIIENKGTNERKWRRLYLVHKFLNLFLKRKMEREMIKYKTIEQAFQKIKASTGLSDAREIVNKFVNREQTYSDLLLSIAEYERKIDGQRKVSDELRDKIHDLKENKIPQEKAKAHAGGVQRDDIAVLEKELMVKNEKYRKIKLILDKTYSWAIRMLQKLEKANAAVRFNFYDIYPREHMGEAVFKVIEMCKNYLEQVEAEKDEIPQVLVELNKNITVNQELKDETFMTRNIRVKASPTKHERSRTHESGTSIGSRSKSRDVSESEAESAAAIDEDYDDNLENMHMEELRNKFKMEEAEENRRKKLLEKKKKEDDE